MEDQGREGAGGDSEEEECLGEIEDLGAYRSLYWISRYVRILNLLDVEVLYIWKS